MSIFSKLSEVKMEMKINKDLISYKLENKKQDMSNYIYEKKGKMSL